MVRFNDAMTSWAENSLVNAGLIIAWLVVVAGAIYRYNRGDWSRQRAVVFISMAAGWIAQSILHVAPLFGIGPPVIDWLFALCSLIFVGGLGYTVFLWRQSSDTA